MSDCCNCYALPTAVIWHDGMLTKLLAESGSASLERLVCEINSSRSTTSCSSNHVHLAHLGTACKRDGYHALVNTTTSWPRVTARGGACWGRSTYRRYLGDWISAAAGWRESAEGRRVPKDRLAAAAGVAEAPRPPFSKANRRLTTLCTLEAHLRTAYRR